LPPYAVIVEAKQEKFDEGWGQCLAAMVAAQRLNEKPDLALFGIVTTGVLWRLGRFHKQLLVQDPRTFTLADLKLLCGAVRYVFDEVSKYPAPPRRDVPQAAGSEPAWHPRCLRGNLAAGRALAGNSLALAREQSCQESSRSAKALRPAAENSNRSPPPHAIIGQRLLAEL
jgi:hypothetical protein